MDKGPDESFSFTGMGLMSILVGEEAFDLRTDR